MLTGLLIARLVLRILAGLVDAAVVVLDRLHLILTELVIAGHVADRCGLAHRGFIRGNNLLALALKGDLAHFGEALHRVLMLRLALAKIVYRAFHGAKSLTENGQILLAVADELAGIAPLLGRASKLLFRHPTLRAGAGFDVAGVCGRLVMLLLDDGSGALERLDGRRRCALAWDRRALVEVVAHASTAMMSLSFITRYSVPSLPLWMMPL